MAQEKILQVNCNLKRWIRYDRTINAKCGRRGKKGTILIYELINE